MYYENIGGYHAAKLRLYQDFLDQALFDARGLPNANALDLTGTRFIVSPRPLPGTTPVYSDEQTRLYVLERDDPLPRAHLVGSVDVIEQDSMILRKLKSPEFDPGREALVLEEPDFDVVPVDSTSATGVDLMSYDAREILWRVTSDAPRLLVTAEVYYPAGWRATVDDEPVQIRRVNYLFRGVPVPEGEHEVRMVFEPSSHYVGLWIAGITTLLVYAGIAFLLWMAWRRRRATSAT
jgi:hypothetical protein